MVSDRSTAIIQNSSGTLKNPVRVVLFTAEVGCAACPDMSELVRAIKARFAKVALETYDVTMDRDKSEQYGITGAPAVVIQAGDGPSVAFYGMIEDVFLEVLINSLTHLSDTKAWFTDDVRKTLKHLEHDVNIRVFVESDCALCRPVAETAICLAFESAFIHTDIIIASDFPELIRKYDMKTLPRTIFGENLFMDGHVTESEFLEMIFEAEGVKPGPHRRCLVCGNESPDIICQNCKTRIQAEAINHKLKSEKEKQTETS